MPSRYAQWMYDWEHRLTSVDNNRVVRPLEWGVEWTRDWPCRNGYRPGPARRIILRSSFWITTGASSRRATNFIPTRGRAISGWRLARCRFSPRAKCPIAKLEAKVKGTFGEFLRFTSPVKTPYPENNLVNARWFPARGRRAIVLLPHWNADAICLHQSVPGAEYDGHRGACG